MDSDFDKALLSDGGFSWCFGCQASGRQHPWDWGMFHWGCRSEFGKERLRRDRAGALFHELRAGQC